MRGGQDHARTGLAHLVLDNRRVFFLRHQGAEIDAVYVGLVQGIPLLAWLFIFYFGLSIVGYDLPPLKIVNSRDIQPLQTALFHFGDFAHLILADVCNLISVRNA